MGLRMARKTWLPTDSIKPRVAVQRDEIERAVSRMKGYRGG